MGLSQIPSELRSLLRSDTKCRIYVFPLDRMLVFSVEQVILGPFVVLKLSYTLILIAVGFANFETASTNSYRRAVFYSWVRKCKRDYRLLENFRG